MSEKWGQKGGCTETEIKFGEMRDVEGDQVFLRYLNTMRLELVASTLKVAATLGEVGDRETQGFG